MVNLEMCMEPSDDYNIHHSGRAGNHRFYNNGLGLRHTGPDISYEPSAPLLAFAGVLFHPSLP
jgi:hypothetical protein